MAVQDQPGVNDADDVFGPDTYLALKAALILPSFPDARIMHHFRGAAVCTALGTAFFQWFTHRSVAAIGRVACPILLANWLFTALAIVMPPLSGFALMHMAWWFGRAFAFRLHRDSTFVTGAGERFGAACRVSVPGNHDAQQDDRGAAVVAAAGCFVAGVRRG